MLAIPKECEGTDRDLDALQALEPADEEQESSGTVADLAPCLRAVDRLEHRQVDARRDHEHAVRVRSIQVDEVAALLLGRRHQDIGLLRDLPLDADADVRLGPSALRQGAVLDEAQRVGDVRPARRQPGAQEARDFARQPVVREEKVVRRALAAGEVCDSPGERGDLSVEGVLVQAGAGREIDHARKRGEALHRRFVRRLPAGEDVGGDAAIAEGGRDLVNVDIESAVGVLAQRGGGRRVHGDDRDPPSGAVGEHPVGLSHGTPISRQASV